MDFSTFQVWPGLEDGSWLGELRDQLGPRESASNHGPSQGPRTLQSSAVLEAQFGASFLSRDPKKQRLLCSGW